MYIGSCRLTFYLRDNDSLKGKRKVSRSLITRLQQKFNFAVAEIDGIDQHQRLVIGMACVSKDANYASEMIDNALDYVESRSFDAELVRVERDVFPEG